MHHSVCSVLFVCALTAAAQEAPQPQYTARELFYSAASNQPAPAKPATAPAPAPPKKAATPKKPATLPPPPAVADTPRPPASQGIQPIGSPNSGMVVKASMTTAPAPPSGTPLGLKYTVLRKSGDDMVEVPPDTIFHSGDRIQLSVQTNGPGYLYIIHQGSSGTWQPVFPSSDVAEGDNHVDGWSAHVLPSRSRLLFDEQTGTERIFIVFSRTPEQGLENIIYWLKGGSPKPAQGERAEEKPPAKKLVEVASANIDDGTVGRLRNTYTRDLIIEKVDDKTPADQSASGQKKENAVYVVNPTGSSDSRVVASVELVHK